MKFLPAIVKQHWPIWGISVLVAASAKLLWAASTYDPQGFFGQTTAAWVQGVGTVDAILATGVFLLLDRRKEARRRISSLAGVMRLSADLIEDASRRTAHPYSLEFLGYLARFERRPFDRAAELLDRVPLHDLQSADLAIAVHNMREMLCSAANELQARSVEVHRVPLGLVVNLDEALTEATRAKGVMEREWLAVGGG